MSASSTDFHFTVWGVDNAAYGPIELPILVSWIRGKRVTADTWVFDAKHGAWCKAGQIAELQMFFSPKAGAQTPIESISINSLRRAKILADLTDEQLGCFAAFMEAERVPPWRTVVNQGDNEDSMFIILEGEFRVRVRTGDKETILATLGVGEFFGDIALFDNGPRSADVVSNTDGVVVKITSDTIRKLAAQAPSVALPFLMAMGKTLVARIRSDNKRYVDAVKFARAVPTQAA